MKHDLNTQSFIIPCILALAAALLFLPFLGSVHLFDWDEINFAEISREMLLTGDYFRVHINFEPFWEKPPMFFWLQSACMHVFGVNEFAARLPNALIGCATLPILFLLGKRLFGAAFGLLWACVYAGSFLPAFYFKSGIIDPLFNLWIFLGIYHLSRHWSLALGHSPNTSSHHSSQTAPPASHLPRLLLAGLFIGFAVLTKGPVGYLLAVLTWGGFWAFTRFVSREQAPFPWMELPLFTVVVLLTSLAWYGVEIYRHGIWFFREFVQYQIRLLTTGDAGHSQPFYYHPLVLLVGCFPASAFAFSAFKRSAEDTPEQHAFKRWMIALLIVVVTVFSLVQTKIVHYSSLAYFPITFLGAYTLLGIVRRNQAMTRLAKGLVIGLGALWALLIAAVPLIGMNKEWLMPKIRDVFVRANLAAPVQWSGFEVLIGVGYFCAMALVCWLILKRRYFEMTLTLLVATTLAVFTFTAMIAPRIEGYTQRAAVEFYEGLQGQDCYVRVLGFKSFAHLFYSRQTRSQSPSGANIAADDFERWLLEGEIDKPAYFVCKITGADEWRQHPNLTEIAERYGFVFFKREPRKKSNFALVPP